MVGTSTDSELEIALAEFATVIARIVGVAKKESGNATVAEALDTIVVGSAFPLTRATELFPKPVPAMVRTTLVEPTNTAAGFTEFRTGVLVCAEAPVRVTRESPAIITAPENRRNTGHLQRISGYVNHAPLA